MIVRTQGIVLSYIKYKDTSIIVRIFTQEYGYGSYIVNAIRSQRSKKSMALFQPFCILELVLYVKHSREIQRISEFSNRVPLHRLHQDFYLGSIALFLSEVLSKLLQAEAHENPELYSFLETSIVTLDSLERPANFHLQFLLKLGAHLGFAVSDLGTLFSSTNKIAPTGERESLFQQLSSEPYGTDLAMTRGLRNELLDAIVEYYLHHSNISKPKSLEVLRSILNE